MLAFRVDNHNLLEKFNNYFDVVFIKQNYDFKSGIEINEYY